MGHSVNQSYVMCFYIAKYIRDPVSNVSSVLSSNHDKKQFQSLFSDGKLRQRGIDFSGIIEGCADLETESCLIQQQS